MADFNAINTAMQEYYIGVYSGKSDNDLIATRQKVLAAVGAINHTWVTGDVAVTNALLFSATAAAQNDQKTGKSDTSALQHYRNDSLKAIEAIDSHNTPKSYSDELKSVQAVSVAHDALLAKARSGDTSAMDDVSFYIYNGTHGFHKNNNDSHSWDQRSALAGDGTGQENLGYDFENGLGVPQDSVKAYAWYLVAQQNGRDEESNLSRLDKQLNADQIADAKHRATTLIQGATNLVADKDKALAAWKTDAAAAGASAATGAAAAGASQPAAAGVNQDNVADLMKRGNAKAAEGDKQTAYLWYELTAMNAARLGKQATYDAARAASNKLGLDDTAQAAAWQALTTDKVNYPNGDGYFNNAANKLADEVDKPDGNPLAKAVVGACSYNGTHYILQNDDNGFKYSHKAAYAGNVTGQYNTGYGFENGKGVAQDTKYAAGWYMLSMANGHDTRDDLKRLVTAGVSLSDAVAAAKDCIAKQPTVVKDKDAANTFLDSLAGITNADDIDKVTVPAAPVAASAGRGAAGAAGAAAAGGGAVHVATVHAGGVHGHHGAGHHYASVDPTIQTVLEFKNKAAGDNSYTTGTHNTVAFAADANAVLDKELGKKTAAAINKFETAKGLTPTPIDQLLKGKIPQKTLDAFKTEYDSIKPQLGGAVAGAGSAAGQGQPAGQGTPAAPTATDIKTQLADALGRVQGVSSDPEGTIALIAEQSKIRSALITSGLDAQKITNISQSFSPDAQGHLTSDFIRGIDNAVGYADNGVLTQRMVALLEDPQAAKIIGGAIKAGSITAVAASGGPAGAPVVPNGQPQTNQSTPGHQ